MKRTLLSVSLLLVACSGEQGGDVTVGSKNFTESVILGEVLAQTLERAGCQVDRKLNMGGTFVADRAIRNGEIDAYVEYSGTALTAILNQGDVSGRERIERLIREEYEKAGLIWGPALGFENTFAMIVRRDYADEHRLRTISDLAKVESVARPGFGYEFAERPDGWRGLLREYELDFTNPPSTMDLGLTYRALAEGRIDLIAGNSTDGLIEHLELLALEDDREYFPPYDAVVVHRAELDSICSGAAAALGELEGRFDAATMRSLNYEVDGEKQDVGVVVARFLESAP